MRLAERIGLLQVEVPASSEGYASDKLASSGHDLGMAEEASPGQIADEFWAARGGRPDPGADLKQMAKKIVDQRFTQPAAEARQIQDERIRAKRLENAQRMKEISRSGNGMDVSSASSNEVLIGPRGGRYRINKNG
ncbi:hypothetical protein SynRS9915_01302 [Synechococcus sp. RS9915]|nr:hypothetical protein SynRS9915_01302 [Synechococcus sp. RS9915]